MVYSDYLFQVMRPPLQILQCGEGHLICSTCRQNPLLPSCPSCRYYLTPASYFLPPTSHLPHILYLLPPHQRPLESSQQEQSHGGSGGQAGLVTNY